VRGVVLLSGGLDSATAAAIARAGGLELYALTVVYGQRHAVEVDAARRVARALGVAEHRVVELPLAAFGGSALTGKGPGEIPKDRPLAEIGAPGDVPATYVPARNTVLCALALAWAEALGATEIVLGVNVLDASGYPDCRPEFVAAFERLANVATRAGGFTVRAPLIAMTKAQIIRRGLELGVDYALTHSCYDPGPDGGACGRCDACLLRRKGFAEAGVPDPTRYSAR
jgi:7-cyano-7-deazaguanine synthase